MRDAVSQIDIAQIHGDIAMSTETIELSGKDGRLRLVFEASNT